MTASRNYSLERLRAMQLELRALSTRSDPWEPFATAGETVANNLLANGFCTRSARWALMTFAIAIGFPAGPFAHFLRRYDDTLKPVMSTETAAHNRETTLSFSTQSARRPGATRHGSSY